MSSALATCRGRDTRKSLVSQSSVKKRFYVKEINVLQECLTFLTP